MPITLQDILFYHNKFTSFQKLVFVASIITLLFSLFRPWLLLFTLIASIALGVYFCRFIINRLDPFRSDVLVNAYNAIVDLQNETSSKKNTSTHSTDDTDNVNNEDSENVGVIHEELERYVNLILRDFVQSWYKNLTSDKLVLEEAGDVLYASLIKFADGIKEQDKINLAVDIISLYRKHLCEFQVAYRTYKSQSKRRKYSTSDLKGKLKRSFSIEESFELKFKYHPAVLNTETELSYLRKIVSILFENVFPGDTLASEGSKILLGEIIACKVLLPVICLMSRTEWIFEKLVQLTSYEEPVYSRRPSETGSDACDVNLPKVCNTSTAGDQLSESSDTVVSKPRHTSKNTNNCINKVTFQIEDEFKDIPDDDIPPSLPTIPDDVTATSDQDGRVTSKSDVHISPLMLKPACPVIVVSKSDDKHCPDNTLNGDVEDCEHSADYQSKESTPDSKISTFAGSNGEADKKDVKELQSSINEKYLHEHKEKTSLLSDQLSDGSPKDCVGDNASVSSSEQDQDEYDDKELDLSITFQDVKIIGTEKAQEPRSTTSYTLYTIQYNAVLKTKGGDSTVESGTVNRRFREFVNLQARLDDNSKYKKLLKDIKGPKRWLSLPFGNMDKESVETRRKFLDTFLKALCLKDEISSSLDLKEFLAFQGDSRIAFVRKVTDISVPRIDKMFVRTFTGMFDKIAEALPSFPQEVLPNITNKRESPVFSKDGDILITEDSNKMDIHFGVLSEQSVTSSLKSTAGLFLLDYIPQEKCSKETEQETTPASDSIEEKESKNSQEEASTSDEASSGMSDEANSVDSMVNIPMANSVLDFAVQAMNGRDNWMCRERVLKATKIVIGRALDRWLQTKLDSLTTTSRCLYYLQLLRDTIWPNGKLSDKEYQWRTMKEKVALELQTKRCLLAFIPGLIHIVVGREDFQGGVDQILESVQHGKLNRHFIYTLIDLLVLRLFPDQELTQEAKKL